MGIKIPKQTVAENKGKIATIGFTLDWSGDDVSTGPSVPVTPPVTEQFTISYITDGNGGITGNSSATIDKDSTLTFPTVTANEGYVFDKWVNSVSNEEVTTSTIVTADMSVKALFKIAEVEKVSVNFVADENGSLEGQTNVEIAPGDTVAVFPTPKPVTIAYAFDKWVDSTTNTEISTTTPITSDLTIKALFALRPSNPSNWFTVNTNGFLTGFTDEYANMADAPTDLVIPRQVGGVQVTGIGANAFKGRSALTSIVLPDTVTQIGVSAFENCSNLLNIIGLDNVTLLGSKAFVNCSSLKSIKLYNISKISEITIGSDRIYYSPFVGCVDLAIELSGNMKTIPYGLFVSVRSDIKRVDGTTRDIVPGTFSSIILPEKLEIIHESDFYGISAPVLDIPNNVITIEKNAFYSSKIPTINISNSVKTIDTTAFSYFGTNNIKNINIDNTKNAIVGSPWGATNTTITWLR